MEVRQEEDRVPGKKVIVIAAGVAVVSAAYILAAWAIGSCRTEALAPGGYVETARVVPDEVNAMEMTLFDTVLAPELDVREQRAYLGSFGWIDPERGIAHIPIDLAIDLYLEERGVEVRRGDDPQPIVPGIERAPGAVEPDPPDRGAAEETIR